MNIAERPIIHEELPDIERPQSYRTLQGLGMRLYLGSRALNPETSVSPEAIGKTAIEEYEVLDYTSQHERKTYWEGKNNNNFGEQKNQWNNNIISLFSDNTSFFAESQKGRRWADLFIKIGIDPHDFSEQTAEHLYERYFSYKDETFGVKKFIADMYNAHLKDDGALDIALLQQNNDAIEWISHIFGEESSQIISCFTQIKIGMQDEATKQELVKTSFDNQPEYARINTLTLREKELLSLVWHRKQELGDIPQETTDIHPTIPEPEPEEEPSEENAPIIDNESENELSAEEIADRLLNYETGSPTGEQFDLRDSFIGFAKRALQQAEIDNRFSSEKPTIILSNVANAMLLKILESSNRKNIELAFVIRGLRKNFHGKDIFIAGLVSPAMDFRQGSETEVYLDPPLADRQAQKLARATSLSHVFSTLGSFHSEKGDILCIGHTHQAPLGRRWIAHPSIGDFQNIRDSLEGYPANTSYEWGVFTLADNNVYKKILSSTLVNGELIHKELSLLTESDL